jgi:aminomethyltransferase
MAEFLVTGREAAALLDYSLAGRLSTMPIGAAKYSLLLTDSGGIIDDVIVYRLAEDRFLVIANAGNRDAVAAAFAERAERAPIAAAFLAEPAEGVHYFGVVDGSLPATVEDVSDDVSLIAVQGPASRLVVEAAAGIADLGRPLDLVPYYASTDATFDGTPLVIARTGYTGEDGFELLVANDRAPALWDSLLAAGGPLALVPAGLAARDTLRLEAGMALYGHELSRDIVPAQAGLARVVATDKDDFVGRAGLAGDADAPVLVGLVSEGRRAGRSGYSVFDGEERVGEITSGALSPTLGHPIAMAFVHPAASAPGTELSIDVRGTRIPATVTVLPFYRRKK